MDRVQRVELGSDALKIHIDLSGLIDEDGAVARLVVRMRIRRRGVETRLVLLGADATSSDPRVDPALFKAIVRARGWFEDLSSGRARSLEDIGKADNVSDRYVGALMPLAFLSPEIVGRILCGTQPIDLTAVSLTTRVSIPLGWQDQKRLLGLA